MEYDASVGQPGGERVFATLMFCDLCGSTRLAAHLDPDIYLELLEAVRLCADSVVAAHGGRIAQIYGDGMLVVFPDARGPGCAVAAARDLHAAVSGLDVPPGAPSARLLMHSGIHAGLVVLRAGDAARGRLEAVGRATGIAARLAAAARPDEILVTRVTLGPFASGLPLGSARKVKISDTDDVVEAVPVLGQTIAGRAGDGWQARRSPFVGREEILSDIIQALGAGGKPPSIAVIAPAGQGKSRLADAVASLAEAAGRQVVRGAAAPAAVTSVLGVWQQIIASLPGDQGGTALPEEPPALAHDRILSRVLQAASRAPLLLVLDDWHWADSASVTLLARLRAQEGCPALLLLSREAAPHGFSLPADRLLQLPPLSLEETRALVAARRPELDPLDAAHVHARAGGNPLFVEELLKLPSGALRAPMIPDGHGDGHGWMAALIADRVRQLPQSSIDLLFTAAVIGPEFPIWVLATMTGAAADTPDLVLLRDADLLAPSHETGRLRFAHGVTWEVVLNLVPHGRRRALHRRLAELLAGHSGLVEPERDEALARHYHLGGDLAAAAVHAARAGAHAQAHGSIDRARACYGLALDALLDLPDEALDPGQFASMVDRFGFCCMFDAEHEHLATLARAARKAASLGDVETEAQTARWSAFILHGQGRQTAAEQQCRRALALTRAPQSSPVVVQLQASLGEILIAAGRYAEGRPMVAEGIRIKRASRSGRNPSHGLAYALALEGAMHGDLGKFDAAWDRIEEAFAVLNGSADPVEGSVIGWACAILAWQERWEDLAAMAGRGCHIAMRIETVYVHAVCRAFEAYARYRCHPGPEPAEQLETALACMVDRGKGLAQSMVHGFMAEVAAEQGNIDAARHGLHCAYVRHRLGEPFGVAQAARAWASVLAASRPERARLFLARARRNALSRQSAHECAKTDLAEARLGLRGPEASACLAQRAGEAFALMGMHEAAGQAAALSRLATAPERPGRLRA